MIVILAAMDCEVQALLGRIPGTSAVDDAPYMWQRGRLAGHEVVVAKTGVGKVLAAACAQRAIDRFNPAAILCTGVAGALVSELRIGDIVVSTDCVQHDVDARALGFRRGEIPYERHFSVEADKELIKVASKFRASPARLHFGRILSGDQFVASTGKQDTAHLNEELGGLAVEMEGASVALVCHINAIPFLVIRTISDVSDGKAALEFNAAKQIAAQNSASAVEFIVTNAPEGKG